MVDIGTLLSWFYYQGYMEKMSKDFWTAFLAAFLVTSVAWGIILTVENFYTRKSNCIHLRG